MASIKIDDRDYNIDSLSEEAKAQLSSLQFCELELQRLQVKTAAYQTAKMNYARVLKEELEKSESSAKSTIASSGNGEDKTQSEPEKKKGLWGLFGKK